MGWLNRRMIDRLRRRLAVAPDHNTRVDIDRALAFRCLREERGETFRPPLHWLAVPGIVVAFFIPEPWLAAALGSACGIWFGLSLKG